MPSSLFLIALVFDSNQTISLQTTTIFSTNEKKALCLRTTKTNDWNKYQKQWKVVVDLPTWFLKLWKNGDGGFWLISPLSFASLSSSWRKLAKVGLGRCGWAKGVREEVWGWNLDVGYFCVGWICGVKEPLVGWVKSSTWGDNALIMAPSHVCVFTKMPS